MRASLLKNNLALKILALLMALLFWAYVTSDKLHDPTNIQEITRRYDNVPLAWLNLGEDLELVEMPPEVQVVLSGSFEVLNSITPQNLKAFVDLRNLDAGQHRLAPTAELPDRVRVLSFSPPLVLVELEEVESPQLPVVVDITGAPASGFTRAEAQLNPAVVAVRGGKTRLQNVDRVRVIVNIEGITAEWSQIVPVQAVDRAGQVVEGVEISPGQVEVLIPVAAPQKEVPVKVSTVGEPAAGYKLQQIKAAPATVVLEGTEEDLAAISEIITETVDLSSLQESTVLNLSLEVPPKVKLLFKEKIKAEIILH